MEEHATIFHFLYELGILPKWLPEVIPISWIVIIILGVAAYFSTRKLERLPGSMQMFGEWVVETFEKFAAGIIGPHGKKFAPFIGSLFLFILGQNLMIQIPGFNAPTANANTTIALAVITFFVVQFSGLSANGISGYFLHLAGSPKDAVGWALFPLMFVLEVIGELAKPLSLSMRLFGNIYGEDAVILILMGIAAHTLYFIPVHLPMALFAIFGGTVQALVFAMLTCIYLSIMTSHGDEHH
ncbi:MAG: ATP synthase F0 subunit A [Candidatus Cloacimonetes bacterium 4572_55]|nr:MAG: ATP synthase F0 subunit A [Candidatus Cloacimonetes bacterium 4572_55]